MTELIECDDCGRSFATEQPVEMLAAIKGTCPTCGGRFRLAQVTAGAAPPPPAPAEPRPAPAEPRRSR
ncbi:MAG: hypothetical protein QOJ63_2132 [Solirubrobacteraceae bacterium]|jgi:hypothetical protein|nr:hypothetical protein [Solirubrobacteraceae bacterium]